MPVQFLSDEWTTELQQRLNESESFRMAAMMPEGTAMRMPTMTLATTRVRVGTKASSRRQAFLTGDGLCAPRCEGA